MSLGKKLFIGGTPACTTDSVNPFDDGFTSSKALYQFDGNANDTAGNYNATASSGVTYTSGYIGQAVTMGGNDSINTNDGGALLGDTWSISFFVKFDNANDYEYIAANWRSNPTPRLTSWYLLKRNSSNSNVLEFNVYGSNGTNSNYKQFIAPVSSAFTSNTWYHIAISFNGLSATDVGMYINGLPVSYTTSTGSGWDGSAQISNTLDTTIGGLGNSSGGDNYLDGQIDQVRFFNKAISDAEALILKNETTDTASVVNVLNDGSGLALYSLDYDASDASGNGDGTPTDVTFGVDGQINWGAEFNGSGSAINIGGSQFNSLTSITISSWINSDANDTYSIIANVGKLSTDGKSLSMARSRSTVNGSLSPRELYVSTGSSTFDGNYILETDTWYNVVATYSGTSLKIYVNGNLTASHTVASMSFDSSGNGGYLGRGLNNSYPFHWNGTIDQVRVFNKALSSSEVSTLYAETACVYTPTTDNNDYPVTNTAYYKLDNNAEDAKGSYDGAESNITYEFGRYGQAAGFSGTSYITVTGITSTSTFSYSLWVKPTNASSSGFKGIFGKQNTEGQLFTDSGALKIWTTTTQTFTGSPTLSDNVWSHIVLSVSNGTGTIYVNGIDKGTATGISLPSTLYMGTASTQIGVSTYGYQGLIDQVRIFDSALDATAVENLYNEKPEVNTSNFETVLYNGNGGSQYISNVGFQPDLVWIKSRGINYDHQLHDSVRGAGNGLLSNSNVASVFYNTVTSFDSNGFFVNAPGTYVGTNANNQNFVAWCWKGGGDAIDNTNGNITSQVSANQDAGFSIVKYTGNGSVMTIGHGLSSAPELIIFKSTNTTQDWLIATTVIDGSLDYFWDATAGFGAATKSDLPWSVPDSSVINFGSSSDVINNLSGTQQMIAYCFHSVAGYQKVGSYTGGGSSGKTVTTGFRPSWVMIKRTDVSNYWVIIDSKRDTTDPYSKILWANVSDIEADGGTATAISFSDTGFSMSTSVVGSSVNATGGTYIYLAIA